MRYLIAVLAVVFCSGVAVAQTVETGCLEVKVSCPAKGQVYAWAEDDGVVRVAPVAKGVAKFRKLDPGEWSVGVYGWQSESVSVQVAAGQTVEAKVSATRKIKTPPAVTIVVSSSEPVSEVMLVGRKMSITAAVYRGKAYFPAVPAGRWTVHVEGSNRFARLGIDRPVITVGKSVLRHRVRVTQVTIIEDFPGRRSSACQFLLYTSNIPAISTCYLLLKVVEFC